VPLKQLPRRRLPARGAGFLVARREVGSDGLIGRRGGLRMQVYNMRVPGVAAAAAAADAAAVAFFATIQ